MKLGTSYDSYPSQSFEKPSNPPGMDRIEPVEDPNARGDPPESHTQPPEPSSSSRPPLATLYPREGSNRTRRPTIRLSRPSSICSTDSANAQQLQQSQSSHQPGPSSGSAVAWQPTIHSPVAEEDESWQAGRRRSNSEPRPGRWSSPSPNVLSRVATPMRMMPVSEESSHRSPMSPVPQESETRDKVPEQLEPPPAAARAPNRNMRRSSIAAMNPFTRNRASTVTGAPPTLSAQQDQRTEYGPHVVDMLDVIGKALARAPRPLAPDRS